MNIWDNVMNFDKFEKCVRDKDYDSIRNLFRQRNYKFCYRIKDLHIFSDNVELMKVFLDSFLPPIDMELYHCDTSFILDNYGKYVKRDASRFLIKMLTIKKPLSDIKTFVSYCNYDRYNLRELVCYALHYNYDLDAIRFIFSMERKNKIDIHSLSSKTIKAYKKYNPPRPWSTNFDRMSLFNVAMCYSRLDVMKFLIRRKSTHGTTQVSTYREWVLHSGDLNILKYLMSFQGMRNKFDLHMLVECAKYPPIDVLEFIFKYFVKTLQDLKKFVTRLQFESHETLVRETFHYSLEKYGLANTFQIFMGYPKYALELMEMDENNKLHSIVHERKSMITYEESGNVNYQIAAYAHYKYEYHIPVSRLVWLFNGMSMKYKRTKTFKYMVEIYPELPYLMNVFEDDEHYDKTMGYVTGNGRPYLYDELCKMQTYFRLTYPAKTEYHELMPLNGQIERWKRFYIFVINNQNI